MLRNSAMLGPSHPIYLSIYLRPNVPPEEATRRDPGGAAGTGDPRDSRETEPAVYTHLVFSTRNISIYHLSIYHSGAPVVCDAHDAKRRAAGGIRWRARGSTQRTQTFTDPPPGHETKPNVRRNSKRKKANLPEKSQIRHQALVQLARLLSPTHEPSCWPSRPPRRPTR